MTRDFNISTRVYNYWCETPPHVKAIINIVRILITRRLIISIRRIIVELKIKLKLRRLKEREERTIKLLIQ